MDPLDRARAAERAWWRALATTVAPVTAAGRTVGEVLLTAPVARIRDHNAVVLDPAPELDGEVVAGLLDHELGGRGVPHRRLYAHPDDADRWAAALGAHGYHRADVVVLRWPGGRVEDGGDVTVVEADAALAERTTRVVRATDLDMPHAEAFLDQLAWLVRAQHTAGARVLVALDGDRPLGHVRVFPGDGVAQLEELDVHPDAQGRGVGRALLTAALAGLDGVPLVFLTAEPDDWPVRWYARLGFQRLGRSSGFVRSAETSPA